MHFRTLTRSIFKSIRFPIKQNSRCIHSHTAFNRNQLRNAYCTVTSSQNHEVKSSSLVVKRFFCETTGKIDKVISSESNPLKDVSYSTVDEEHIRFEEESDQNISEEESDPIQVEIPDVIEKDHNEKRVIKTIEVIEEELEESFVRGSGRGGQKVNKTSNCVRLVHKPTGISVKCHAFRSREQNRHKARKLLKDALDLYHNGDLSKKTQKEIKKINKSRKAKSEKARKHRKKKEKKEAKMKKSLPEQNNRSQL